MTSVIQPAGVAGPTGPHDVAVVGSINRDLGVGIDRMPSAGETVLGDDARWSAGGKGANQAVGCARLGLHVAMIGALGVDVIGDDLATTLADEGMDLRAVARVDAPTGLAVVFVDRSGESTIVVSPGANVHVTPSAVERSTETIRHARALVCQLEIPLASVIRAAEIAEGLVICNPAPGQPLPDALLANVDVLVPNRQELATLVGRDLSGGLRDLEEAARTLEGPGAVVVTLGSDGALVVEGNSSLHVPAVAVTVVDTTGAGDSFCAALTAGLLSGDDLPAAVRAAVRVAAITTTRFGALDALPSWKDVDAALTGAGPSG